MEPLVLLLVLLAAASHATWNAFVKAGADKLVSLCLVIFTTSLPALAALPFLPIPAAAAWPYLIVSALVHYLYYAFLIAGLLDLYETTSELNWLDAAIELQARLDRHHADGAGGYFMTSDDHETLLAREKPAYDGAEPSGNSVAALNLLRLVELTSDDRYLERAALLFSAFHELLVESPTSAPGLLLALDFLLDDAKEIVLVRPPDGQGAEPLLTALRSVYTPNRVVAIATEGDDLASHAALVPLVARKQLPTARPPA